VGNAPGAVKVDGPNSSEDAAQAERANAPRASNERQPTIVTTSVRLGLEIVRRVNDKQKPEVVHVKRYHSLCRLNTDAELPLRGLGNFLSFIKNQEYR